LDESESDQSSLALLELVGGFVEVDDADESQLSTLTPPRDDDDD